MKKLNNKGFSLVELIIVIAIMAILVGVVGSQVIPYLENSRKAKDIQILSSWNTSAMSAYSGAAAIINANADYKIEITGGSSSVATSITTAGATDPYDSCGAITKAFNELTGFNVSPFTFATNFESKAGKDISKVTISIKAVGGMQMDITNGNPGTYHFDAIYSK